MKFVTFSSRAETTNAQTRTLGESVPAELLNCGVATPGLLVTGKDGEQEVASLSSLGYRSVRNIIEAGPDALDRVRKAESSAPRVPLSRVTLHAPIPRPPRVFAIGLNYQKHADESKMAVQKVPTVFLKLTSSIVGPDALVILPKISTQPDYEAEFAVVIGKRGYQIAEKDWKEYVFGYTIVNDVSARDVQLATSQWTLGKSFPTFTPMGPAIVTADEVPDPHALDISLTPRSRILAVAITLNPGRAWSTRSASRSSGTIITFSESTLTSESWISGGQRVISSNRTITPSRMPT